MSTVILAYNGSLNTTTAIHWLRHHQNKRVITYSADVGQGYDLEPLAELALNAGAEAAHVVDLKKDFSRYYITPALQARAQYQNGYWLGPALTRPLLARQMALLAQEVGAKYIAHGCSTKGNDQIRFETTLATLAPHLKPIAPMREWPMKSREELYLYADRYDLTLLEEREKVHSYEKCLWGATLRMDGVEDPWKKIDRSVFASTKNIEDTPTEAQTVTLQFDKGIPVAMDGQDMGLPTLIETLNTIGGEHGVGRIDTIEDRVTGMKTRAIYESPAATILHQSHEAIEHIVLSSNILFFKKQLSLTYGRLIYEGLFFSELRRALDAFFQSFQGYVTGEVRVKLHHASCHVIARRSPYSQYDLKQLDPRFIDPLREKSADGFMEIYKLPVLAEASIRRRYKTDHEQE